MAVQYVMQRDTASWQIQVWSSFGLALLACTVGVLRLPSQELDRAFLAIGFFFCLFTCFAVAKTQRDNRDEQVDTQGWVLAVWIAFAAAISLTGWGLWRMAISEWQKGYMVVAWLFLVSTTFTLSKTLRDKHDAAQIERNARATAEARAASRSPAA
ncbi:MAG: YiaA/YiaB family inner membrane protein [Rhizobacter sp.]